MNVESQASLTPPAMRSHVEFLEIVLVCASVVSAVVAAIGVLLGLGALSIAWRAVDEPTRVAGAIASSLFFAAGAAFGVWALARYLAARGLARRSGPARLTALAVAALDAFLVPFGPFLSWYTVWVLMHRDVRQSFRAH